MSKSIISKVCEIRLVNILTRSVVLFAVLSWPAMGTEYGEKMAKEVWDEYQINQKLATDGVQIYVEKLKEKGLGAAVAGVAGTYLGGQLDGDGRCVANCRVYDVIDVPQKDGTTEKIIQAVSPMEVAMRAGISQKAFVLNEAGAALIYAQGEINSVMGGPALESVFDYSDAKFMWPSNMFAVGGRMMINTATAINETESSMASKNERAEAESDLIADLMNRLIPVGLQKIGDSSAIHYQATDMQASAPPNDNSGFVPTSASIWIDIDKYVVIKHRIDGVATADGTTGEYYIEVENSDFRSPIGCGAMYEPYRRATRMGGILNDQQMAEMQDARLQLEDYDNQMASLPADQRAMMEDMMGDQMNTLRGLADNGAMEYVEEIEEVFCNPDLKVLFGRTEAPSSEDLLQQIQVHLVALGYEPGNTDGILDMMTQVAISQFQAEHGLAVTGEPNQILAVALANEVKELGA